MMGVVDAGAGVPSQNRVRTYRAYRLDDSGRVTEAASLFEAPDDATAIARARARALMGDRGRFEIWDRSRQVGLVTLVPGITDD
jgi:hypothetical protein